jgi:hypothetical protein
MLSSAIVIPSMIFLLSAAGVGGLLLAVFYRRITVGSALDRQVEMISASVAASIKQAGADNTISRKRSVEDTLREAAEKQGPRRRRASSRLSPLGCGRLTWDGARSPTT